MKLKQTNFFKATLQIYAMIWVLVSVLFVFSNHITSVGEWDDYSMMTASLINDGDVFVSEDDIAFAKTYFKRLYSDEADIRFSGLKTSSGDEITWYTPIYSALCVPAAILLHWWHIDASYCFPLTNILLIFTVFWIVMTYSSLSDKKKLLLCILLSVNPIYFYITWPSAEVYIYVCLTLACMFFYEKFYKSSALMISLAGAQNQVFLWIGIVFVFPYLYSLMKHNTKKERSIGSLFEIMWQNKKELLSYALCYVPALCAIAYNVAVSGNINISNAKPEFTAGNTIGAVFERFVMYFIDLNLGFLPYLNFFLLLAFALLGMAIIQKNKRYLTVMTAFFGCIVLYSVMAHINHGMSGISRYNVDICGFLIVGVIYYLNELHLSNIWQKLINLSLGAALICMGAVLMIYHPYRAFRASYIDHAPFAKFVLSKMPALYNPLPSTFNARTNHIDGGYDYELPIVFQDSDLFVRKILLNQETKLQMAGLTPDDEKWLQKKISEVHKLTYINIPQNIRLMDVKTSGLQTLEVGQTIYFESTIKLQDYIFPILYSKYDQAYKTLLTEKGKYFLLFQIKSYNPLQKYVLKVKTKMLIYNQAVVDAYFSDDKMPVKLVFENNKESSIPLEVWPTGVVYAKLMFGPDKEKSAQAVRNLRLESVRLETQN